MEQQNQSALGSLMALSGDLSNLIARAAHSVVRVEDGSHLTATGIIWSADGVIVTTSHGVERDEELSIEGAGGAVYPATLVGRDPDTDVAVLRVNENGLQALPHADEEEVKVGSLIAALARPGRSGQITATMGIVSSISATQSGSGKAEFLVHTDADLYPGFSGGPLIDMAGRMIGLTNLMFGRGKSIALGTPIIAHITEELLKNGRVQRGYLGIRTQQVTLPEAMKETQSVTQERGLLIAQVEEGSPAQQGGLLLGDTLLAIEQQPVPDVDALRRLLHLHTAGEKLAVLVLRGGRLETVIVTLGTE